MSKFAPSTSELAIVAGGFAAVAVGTWTHPQPAAALGAPVRIAVLGDSLALGTGAGDTSGGFAFRIYRTIERERPGSEITNVAIGGSTADDVIRLQVQRLRETRFDLVMVCVGGNDVVRAISRAHFASAYGRLIAAIRATAPSAAIIAIGVPDVAISPLFGDHSAAVHRLSAADDRAARAIATRAGARYVDLFALTDRMRDAAGFLSLDRFHPSDEGHAKIAAQALPAVEAALHAQRD